MAAGSNEDQKLIRQISFLTGIITKEQNRRLVSQQLFSSQRHNHNASTPHNVNNVRSTGHVNNVHGGNNSYRKYQQSRHAGYNHHHRSSYHNSHQISHHGSNQNSHHTSHSINRTGFAVNHHRGKKITNFVINAANGTRNVNPTSSSDMNVNHTVSGSHSAVYNRSPEKRVFSSTSRDTQGAKILRTIDTHAKNPHKFVKQEMGVLKKLDVPKQVVVLKQKVSVALKGHNAVKIVNREHNSELKKAKVTGVNIKNETQTISSVKSKTGTGPISSVEVIPEMISSVKIKNESGTISSAKVKAETISSVKIKSETKPISRVTVITEDDTILPNAIVNTPTVSANLTSLKIKPNFASPMTVKMANAKTISQAQSTAPPSNIKLTTQSKTIELPESQVSIIESAEQQVTRQPSTSQDSIENKASQTVDNLPIQSLKIENETGNCDTNDSGSMFVKIQPRMPNVTKHVVKVELDQMKVENIEAGDEGADLKVERDKIKVTNFAAKIENVEPNVEVKVENIEDVDIKVKNVKAKVENVKVKVENVETKVETNENKLENIEIKDVSKLNLIKVEKSVTNQNLISNKNVKSVKKEENIPEQSAKRNSKRMSLLKELNNAQKKLRDCKSDMQKTLAAAKSRKPSVATTKTTSKQVQNSTVLAHENLTPVNNKTHKKVIDARGFVGHIIPNIVPKGTASHIVSRKIIDKYRVINNFSSSNKTDKLNISQRNGNARCNSTFHTQSTVNRSLNFAKFKTRGSYGTFSNRSQHSTPMEYNRNTSHINQNSTHPRNHNSSFNTPANFNQNYQPNSSHSVSRNKMYERIFAHPSKVSKNYKRKYKRSMKFDRTKLRSQVNNHHVNSKRQSTFVSQTENSQNQRLLRAKMMLNYRNEQRLISLGVLSSWESSPLKYLEGANSPPLKVWESNSLSYKRGGFKKSPLRRGEKSYIAYEKFKAAIRNGETKQKHSKRTIVQIDGRQYRKTDNKLISTNVYKVRNGQDGVKDERKETIRKLRKSKQQMRRKWKKADTKRVQQQCRYYTTFGRCFRGESCPFSHDSPRLMICKRFLQGKCTRRSCTFSHEMSQNRMPTCSHFLRGKCSRQNCPYPHVNVGADAETCRDFQQGFCNLGDKCKKKHIYLSTRLSNKKSSPISNNHRLKRDNSKTRLYTTSTSADCSRRSSPRETKSKANQRDVTFTGDTLPAFISITPTTPDGDPISFTHAQRDSIKIKPAL